MPHKSNDDDTSIGRRGGGRSGGPKQLFGVIRKEATGTTWVYLYPPLQSNDDYDIDDNHDDHDDDDDDDDDENRKLIREVETIGSEWPLLPTDPLNVHCARHHHHHH